MASSMLMLTFHSKTNDTLLIDTAISCPVGDRSSNPNKSNFLVSTRLLFLCLFVVICSQNSLEIYNVQLHLTRPLYVKYPGVYKKVVLGNNAKNNTQFTRVGFICFFLFTALCVAMHIILSNDVHPNPGPEQNSVSTASNSLNSSIFSYNLSIIQLNIQSLIQKLDLLETKMQLKDIVVNSETWITPRTSDEDLLISNFSRPYRKDRIGRPGGGVAIYIKQGLHSVPRSDLINGKFAAICVEIILKTHKFLFCGIYRPPNSGHPYWDLIETTFDNLSNSGLEDIVVVGDLNNDMATQSSSTKIRNLISSYNFSQLIVEPTHYTKTSSSIIDLILVSKPENVIFSNVTSPFIPKLIRYQCPTVAYLKYRKPVCKTYKRHIWKHQ